MPIGDVSYSCGQCGFALNLSSSNRLVTSIGPEYSRASRRGILYFLSIDESRFRMLDEVKCGPYFETHKKWGLQRMRTRLLCRKCGNDIGYAHIGSTSSALACLDVNKTLDEAANSNRFSVKIRALQPEQITDEQEHQHQLEQPPEQLKLDDAPPPA